MSESICGLHVPTYLVMSDVPWLPLAPPRFPLFGSAGVRK